ncbi:Predicted dithiol-disulfide isomerase, DsbA family [Frankia canadensis]|uniref:Predicted dithiol-disulfide isomerase, DsbA family n=1 Tax=Frankia canadensis TaxID=1836972 RepID=A0A2I2KM52_9ACTN|nr:DsbA family protein [Frankia canadensis]SNQ46744.1 Predicted dithiol-disulfide isomerase, DsbA family [Frankia canadensis]SOU54034.1 Predicted dithiol-disulfide isomerase, DsbA family [Frankia canadensis]
MRVEIWADVVCPWSYIGKRRIETALAEWDGAPVEAVWRPFRIDPMAPTPASPLARELLDPVVDAALTQCTPGLSPTENRSRVREIAAAEGLGPPWGAAWRANSHAAHRLVALSFEHGGADTQGAVIEEIFKAHFIGAVDISSTEVLVDLADAAERFGVPRARGLLVEGAGDAAVREQLLRGKAIGVTTSPTFVVGEDLLVGAQSAATIAEFLRAREGREGRKLPEEVERFRHSEALLERGDPLGTLELLRPLLDAHVSDPNLRLLAARAYFHSAQLGAARTLLEDLAAASPSDSYVQLLLGRVLERQGRPADAAPHLRMAEAMAPEYRR